MDSIDTAIDKLEQKIAKLKPLYKKTREVLGLDKRSLALFRITMACVVLYDLWDRSYELHAHYSDAGLMPRTKALEFFWNFYWLSVHMMTGNENWQAIIFLIHAIFAILMLIGYRTRLFTFLTWFMVISLQSRNFIVGHGGDQVLRLYLFWSIFLPIGECFSIDAIINDNNNTNITEYEYGRKRKKNHHDNIAFNGASVALLCQIAFLYIFSFFHKTGTEWNVDLTASYYALQLDYFRTPVADIFLMFPGVLKLLTYSVLRWEGYGPLLFFSPFKTHWCKTFAVFGFVVLHMAFQACLRLAIFGWVCAAGATCALPSWVWDSLILPRLRTPKRLGFKLLYNPKSLHSLKAVQIIRMFFLMHETEIVPLYPLQKYSTRTENYYHESDQDAENASPDEGSYAPSFDTTHAYESSSLIVKNHQGAVLQDYDAVMAILEMSPTLFPLYYLMKVPLMNRVGSMAYAVTVGSCSVVSEFLWDKEAPVISIKRKKKPSPIKEALDLVGSLASSMLVLFLLFLAFSWNMENIHSQYVSVPRSFKWLAFSLHLDQHFGMFAPRPPTAQWWYYIPGELDNGTKVELFANENIFNWQGNFNFEDKKPDSLHKSIGSHRWFKVYEVMNYNENNKEVRDQFSKYICREWNKRHEGPERLHSFSIVMKQEMQILDGTRVPMAPSTLWNHVCYVKNKRK